jgi:hypothetical protein
MKSGKRRKAAYDAAFLFAGGSGSAVDESATGDLPLEQDAVGVEGHRDLDLLEAALRAH